MELFKTLVYTNQKDINLYGRYRHILNKETAGGSLVPQLMPMTADIEDIKKLYPLIDWHDVELITVLVRDIKQD